MRGIVYVLAVKKDDFSSFKRDDLTEYSRATSQTEREDEDEVPCKGREEGYNVIKRAFWTQRGKTGVAWIKEELARDQEIIELIERNRGKGGSVRSLEKEGNRKKNNEPKKTEENS